jgi:site-specific DNA recombinase
MRRRSLRLSNGSLLGRPPGEGSPYLLTGLLKCGLCGGGMEVLSSKSGGRRTFHYKCYAARRKGPTACTNKLPAPMADADAAVLRSVESTLMHPDVVARALAYAEAALLEDRSAGQREAIESDLSECEKAMRRLTAAIAKGGELEPLMAALQTHERQRTELRARLAAIDAEPAAAFIDPVAVRRQLKDYLRDWQGLLLGHVGQAQQVLRRLVVGRLTFTPQKGGFYAFKGIGTVRPLLGNAIRLLASPTGVPGSRANPYVVAGSVIRRAA